MGKIFFKSQIHNHNNGWTKEGWVHSKFLRRDTGATPAPSKTSSHGGEQNAINTGAAPCGLYGKHRLYPEGNVMFVCDLNGRGVGTNWCLWKCKCGLVIVTQNDHTYMGYLLPVGRYTPDHIDKDYDNFLSGLAIADL